MMRVDITGWELQNIERKRGELRVRAGLQELATAPAGTIFVGGFTLESPFTGEPWHYTFAQSTTTGAVTMYVYTEEWVQLFTYPLGVMQPRPVITYATASNQLMINSPAMSGALYGLVAGGVMQAVKTENRDPSVTALDIPTGHTASFGDRIAIASGNVVYFNDAQGSVNNFDPRTFTTVGATPFTGTIYDVMQGPGGALFVFTSDGAYSMASDALGKGQIVSGFISKIPGIVTSRPRNACASLGVVGVLQRDSLVILDGDARRVVPLDQYGGKRFFSTPVEQDDLRQTGQIFATASGFAIAFGGSRPFFATYDLAEQSLSFVSNTLSALSLVGTLRSREGGTLYLTQDRALQQIGTRDWNAQGVTGYACGRVRGSSESAVCKSITVTADNVGLRAGASALKTVRASTSPSISQRDILLDGTALWGAGSKLYSREMRSSRFTIGERFTDLQIELQLVGGGRLLDSEINIDVEGQERTRRDSST